MGTRLQWTAEGGTTGTNLTNSNAGGSSGPSPALVTPSNTAAMRFLAAAARRGTLGLRVESVTNTTTYVEWATATSGAARVNLAFAFRLSSLPSGDVVFAGLRGSGGWMAQLVLKSTGAVHARNAATTQLAALTGVTLAPNVWYRVELAATAGISTSSGLIEARIWADETTPPAFQQYTSVNAGTTTATHVRIGVPQSGAAVLLADFDDVEWEEGMTAGTGLGLWPIAPPVILEPVRLDGDDFTNKIQSEAASFSITSAVQTSGTSVGTITISGLRVTFAKPVANTATVEYTVTDSRGQTATIERQYDVASGGGGFVTLFATGWA